ncbi:hypothetical protein K469DRAFT_711135 [Zopfia rhizophila CBS 207.26]|uniref:Uncharacterized protein n=1 Tax=Zopfia rhizophila CBS 207.26 TaxID=1314779 RepID=A0A6A6DWM0_9PEZI|nr:hypothetical protein K469DRAFT_711135 [Zopfia rhizophila CBS 207.26]
MKPPSPFPLTYYMLSIERHSPSTSPSPKLSPSTAFIIPNTASQAPQVPPCPSHHLFNLTSRPSYTHPLPSYRQTQPHQSPLPTPSSAKHCQTPHMRSRHS